MERRTVLRLGVAAGATAVTGISAAQQDTVGVAVGAEADYEEVDKPFPPAFRLYGTNPALGEEEDVARKLLDNAPIKKSLQSTAEYFADLADTNSEGWQYNAQWPDAPDARWNPVLIGFYQSTSLPKPYIYKHGDTTAWCAAFLNWCLIRSGYKHTGSAMSGSFRKYGYDRLAKKESPVAGDIIVFQKTGTAGAAGHGHVAIYLETVAGGYRVLGGNQRAGRRFSSVNTTVFPANGERLKLHSIRAIESMRRT
jgi:uncharacterized protein (TIGR02594 family)